MKKIFYLSFCIINKIKAVGNNLVSDQRSEGSQPLSTFWGSSWLHQLDRCLTGFLSWFCTGPPGPWWTFGPLWGPAALDLHSMRRAAPGVSVPQTRGVRWNPKSSALVPSDQRTCLTFWRSFRRSFCLLMLDLLELSSAYSQRDCWVLGLTVQFEVGWTSSSEKSPGFY